MLQNGETFEDQKIALVFRNRNILEARDNNPFPSSHDMLCKRLCLPLPFVMLHVFFR